MSRGLCSSGVPVWAPKPLHGPLLELGLLPLEGGPPTHVGGLLPPAPCTVDQRPGGTQRVLGLGNRMPGAFQPAVILVVEGPVYGVGGVVEGLVDGDGHRGHGDGCVGDRVQFRSNRTQLVEHLVEGEPARSQARLPSNSRFHTIRRHAAGGVKGLRNIPEKGTLS
jgi:hypothetical protein